MFCGCVEDRGCDLSVPLARLGEFAGRWVMGFVPVQALCGVGVCFLLQSIVSGGFAREDVSMYGESIRAVAWRQGKLARNLRAQSGRSEKAT